MQDKAFWNQNWSAWQEDFTPSPFAVTALKTMKIRAVGNVLDLGCGKGRNSLFFAANGLNVTAFDISDEALETVKKLRHEKIKTMCGDIATTDFGSETYDAVFACLSLHYFDDAQTRQIIKNVHRALTKDGVFFIRCKSVKDRFYGIGREIAPDTFEDDLTRHFFRPDYMQDVLSVFAQSHICETEEDYFGPCAFTDGMAFKADY